MTISFFSKVSKYFFYYRKARSTLYNTYSHTGFCQITANECLCQLVMRVTVSAGVEVERRHAVMARPQPV